ncbi:hypothetical protein L195_g011121 [Trifolium pratense]|uniref:Uncharacterized protein n=1 Tax=Trifolium pratense TaxID=57577 RepID=A0A2K3PEY7_TRIPR|nr:hypothetical protein L195_g010517 [Trifolium pratense]PNY14440.1 hypothetical protein L195_g011121 [Trifolium pratense]
MSRLNRLKQLHIILLSTRICHQSSVGYYHCIPIFISTSILLPSVEKLQSGDSGGNSGSHSQQPSILLPSVEKLQSGDSGGNSGSHSQQPLYPPRSIIALLAIDTN